MYIHEIMPQKPQTPKTLRHEARYAIDTCAGWNVRADAFGGPDGCEGWGMTIPLPDHFTRQIPEGEDRERDVCGTCGFINYVNPKIVVGCLPEWQGKVLLCKRAIEPRLKAGGKYEMATMELRPDTPLTLDTVTRLVSEAARLNRVLGDPTASGAGTPQRRR